MRKIKKYKIEIITYLLFIIFVLFSIYKMWYCRPYYGKGKKYENDLTYEKCGEYIKLNETEKIELANKYEHKIELSDKYCDFVLSYSPPDSAYSIYNSFLISSYLQYIIPFFVPLIILFPVVYVISKEFRSKNIKNSLVREDYKKYIINLFKRAYSTVWVFPLIIVILFLISAYLSNWNFAVSGSVANHFIDKVFLTLTTNKILFHISYIVIILLNVGMYINLSLIVLSKNKNLIISYIESYLLVYVFWAFIYIGIGNLLTKNFNIHSAHANLLAIFEWDSITNINIFLILNIICYLFTFVIAILSYRNKEKLIMMCEK